VPRRLPARSLVIAGALLAAAASIPQRCMPSWTAGVSVTADR
jgi:hypothetical protein